MSHYMTALAMRQIGLKPAAKLVLYWLADHHNERTGDCFPSISRLAELCEMSRRSVEQHLSDLEALGLVERRARNRQEGGKTSNAYTLRLAGDDAQNLRMPPAKSAHGGCAKSAHDLTLEDTNLGSEQEAKASFRKSKRRAEVDLPEGWVLSVRNIMDAKQIGLDERTAQSEAERFADYHRSKQSRFRDWNAAWRTWCRNHINFRNAKPTVSDATARQISFAARASRSPTEDCF